MAELSGILTAMITPFDSEGDLWLDPVESYLEQQRGAGIDGVVVSGTNGEGSSLSVDERLRLLEEVLRHRGAFQVVAGTGAASLTDAVDMTRAAGQAGADAVLVLPPFYFKSVTVDGLAAFYFRVLEASIVPVYLYSIPHQSSIPITDELIDRLSDHPKLAGLKDSGGDWARTSSLIERYPKLRIFSGGDALLHRCLPSKAAGAISGAANAFPELINGVREAVLSGDDVGEAQGRLDRARSIVAEYPLVAANKTVLYHRGLPLMRVRPPLVELTAQQETELIGRLRGVGALP